MIKVEKPCETCGKLRFFKFSEKNNKFYNYKPKCKKCTLTERNKKQNFSKRKHLINDYFEKIDSEIKAYFWGFLWADGCLREQKRENIASVKTVSLTSKDIEIVEMLKTYIGGSVCENNRYDKRTNKTYYGYFWSLNSKEVFENFKKLEFRKNINYVPTEFYNHFLRGLMDGDGNINIREKKSINIKISSSYYQDWSFLFKIKETHNSSIGRYEEKNGNKNSVFRIKGIKEEKINFIRWLYINSEGIRLTRKFEKIKHFLV